jgi:Flp pilus assembly protein TadG
MRLNVKAISLSKLKRLANDTRGVGAVEFAIIFPLLLALYISAFEVTVAYSIYKRTSNAAGTIADLVAQQKSVSKKDLAATAHVAAAIFAPYGTAGLKLKITGILTDASGNGKVSWSWNETNGQPYSVGSSVSLPATMRNPDRFFVRTELEVPHSILRFMTTIDTAITPITLRRDYIFEKRQDEPIAWSNAE